MYPKRLMFLTHAVVALLVGVIIFDMMICVTSAEALDEDAHAAAAKIVDKLQCDMCKLFVTDLFQAAIFIAAKRGADGKYSRLIGGKKTSTLQQALTEDVESREVKDPSGAVQKRSHAAHPKVPGIIPGATWHTVTYCDTWQCYKNTRGMLETATETVGKNAYIFGFKILFHTVATKLSTKNSKFRNP